MPTVLVVEDEVQILTMTESVLQRAGYETLSAATVAEAQAIINSDQRVVVGKMVDRSRQGVPVLYTSGRELTDGMQSLFASNSKYLSKPYTEHQLTETIATMLPDNAERTSTS
jgi:DNA-binding response OmpR family regulator